MKTKETVIRTFADLERVFGHRKESEKKADDANQPEVGMSGYLSKADRQRDTSRNPAKTAVG